MEEFISVTTGVVGLGTFALQSSVALYETIKSYPSHQQRVRDLAEEAASLSGVLGSLVQTVRDTTDLDLSALAIPLRQCAKACKEFDDEIKKCSSRSGGAHQSFRDWARLRYMGEDMDGFRRLLACHKMTITVALTDANLRRSAITAAVTAESIEGYNELLNTTKADLEDRLERIDEKLGAMLGKSLAEPSADAPDLRQIREEKLSTEKSLEICAQLSSHISRLQLAAGPAPGAGGSTDQGSVPERITREGLDDCKHSLSRMAMKLRAHEKLLYDRLTERMKASTTSPAEMDDIARLRDEWESTRESMDILMNAGQYFEKEISIIENHATGDAVQVMVSTNEKTLHGTNRANGWRTRQIGGHMNDETVRQLSRDMVGITIRTGAEEPPPRDETPRNRSPRNETPTAVVKGPEEGRSAVFEERYGGGFKLPPTSESNAPS